MDPAERQIMDPAERRRCLRELLREFGVEPNKFSDDELDGLSREGYEELSDFRRARREGLQTAGLRAARADQILDAAAGGGGSGATGAAAGPGSGSIAADGLDFFYQRFLNLLSRGNITRPNPDVLAAIMRRCAARVLVLSDCGAAVDLYREAELLPGPSTEGHLLTQHGLRVNGPLFPNPAEGSASLLTGATSEGVPVVVKLLAGGGSADGAQQPGGAEAEACRALTESKPADMPLVSPRIVTFRLGDEHKSTIKRPPGLYAALCMPRYVSSLALMVPLPAAAVLAGGTRMAAAVAWIHAKGYTHMDVKADNIFVDSEGRWWLGDFGSTVRTGSPVTSTTIWFAPSKRLDLPAKPEYDWHMLAVALVCEMNRKNWRELLVEGGCTPAKKLIAAVKELHGHEGCKELASFLDELLVRAGYLTALTASEAGGSEAAGSEAGGSETGGSEAGGSKAE